MNFRFHLLLACLAPAFGMPLPTDAAPVASSHYYTDPQSEYVQDATSDRIGTVNMIMCLLGALRPDAMVNAGNYVALADKTKCQSNKAVASNSSNSGGAVQANYMRGIVNATRASNSAPMRVRIWFENQEDALSMDIYIDLTVSEAPSAANAYGQFTMNYCGKDASGGVPGCLMKGRLAATASGISFYEQETGGTRTTQLVLENSGATDSGSGAIRSVQPPGATVDNLFAYDASHFLRGDGTTNFCFTRDKNAAAGSVWRYGVYTSTGARLERNSGFPVKYTAVDSTVYQGFMGYYGLSLPDEAGIANGDTVVKQGANGAAESSYTLVKLGGRLTRFTRDSRTLAQIDRIRFTVSAWQFPSQPFAAFATAAGKSFAQSQADNDQIEMYWDAGGSRFVATGLQSCGLSGCLSNTFATEAAVDNAVVGSGSMARGFQGYSPALGGEIFVNLGSAAPAPSTPVAMRIQELVYPADYPASLYCVSNCLRGSLITLGNLLSGNVHHAGNGNVWNASQLRTYTFSGNLLQDENGGSVVSTVAADSLEGTPFKWGIRTGILADAADLSSPSDLDCTPSAPGGTYCTDRINALAMYYVWETGTNPWNGFTALRDGSDYLRFDPPLNLNFTVPTGAEYGDYAGTSLVLQYSGFGNLWGLPGKCVSPDDNAEISCGSSSNARFVPQFTIPHSLTTGLVTNGGSTYYVKWLDRELRLAEQPLGSCSGLALPSVGSLSLPSASDVQDPSDATNTTVYIGAKPTLTSAPAVIHGVVQ